MNNPSPTKRLISAQQVDLAMVDLVLLDPATNRRLGHPERRRQVRHARPSSGELEDLAMDLL
jgi:hypothetical protein